MGRPLLPGKTLFAMGVGATTGVLVDEGVGDVKSRRFVDLPEDVDDCWADWEDFCSDRDAELG